MVGILQALLAVLVLSFIAIAAAFVLHRLSLNLKADDSDLIDRVDACLLYTSPSPRDATLSRMPSSA